MSKVSVALDSEIIGEFFLRGGPKVNLEDWIENIITDYLERTAEEGGWNEAYYEYRDSLLDIESFEKEFGNPDEGVHWAPLFLPNGTLIRMDYKRKMYSAVVKFSAIHYGDSEFSPSELAREIASGTSRNAWRDLIIKRPTDSEWTLADDLRKRKAV